LFSKSCKFMPFLVAALLASAASPAAADVGDLATGSGTTAAGETFSFSVVGGPGPNPELGSQSASGPLAYSGPFITGTGEAYCMLIDGNTALIKGNITSSTDPTFVAGVWFVVQDNGTPGAGVDRFSGPPSPQDFGCGSGQAAFLPGMGSLLTAGDIVVSGACDNPKEHTDPAKDKCKDKKDKP
jgi:hypothetical protein